MDIESIRRVSGWRSSVGALTETSGAGSGVTGPMLVSPVDPVNEVNDSRLEVHQDPPSSTWCEATASLVVRTARVAELRSVRATDT